MTSHQLLTLAHGGRVPCVMWAQLEGTDPEQNGAIMGPSCYPLCPSGLLLVPVPHTWNVCVPRALLLSTELSLLSLWQHRVSSALYSIIGIKSCLM